MKRGAQALPEWWRPATPAPARGAARRAAPSPREGRGDEGSAGHDGHTADAGAAGTWRAAGAGAAASPGSASIPPWRAMPARSLAALGASWAPAPGPGAPAWAGPRWKAAAAPAGSPGGVVPFWALVAFSFVMLLAPQSMFPFLAPLRPALLAAAIAIGMHAGSSIVAGRPITIVTREVILVGLLAAWSLATLPFSLWVGGSVALMTGIYFKSLALFGLNVNLVTTAKRLRVLAWLFAFAGIPLAFTALRHASVGRFAGGTDEAVKRIAGYEAPLTANPNDLALMLNLLLPFAAALAVWVRRPALKALLWCLVGFDAVGVVLTWSRGGFLTLMTLGLLFGIHKLRGRPWATVTLVPAAAAAALLLWIAPPSYLQHMQTITNYQADPTGSAQARLSDMITAAKIALRHPFIGAGLGMNTLALNAERNRPAWKMVHDVYLEYAVDLGLLGLGLYVALFVSCLQAARRAARGPNGPPGSDAAFLTECGRAIFFALIAFGVAAVFHPVAYHFYFFGMAGLAVAAGRLSTEGSPNAA
jgi:O-antigen ligase